MCELYDSMFSQIHTVDKVDIERLKGDIATLDVEGQTFVYALVYYHNMTNNLALPNIGDKITIDLGAAPKTLLKILYKFTALHRQRMNEARSLDDAQRSLLFL